MCLEKCNIDPSIKERYDIPRSMKECDNTKGLNCGLLNLECRKESYKKKVKNHAWNVMVIF